MNWQIVEPNQIPALAQKMRGWRAVVFDCETTNADIWLGTKVLGVGLSSFEEERYYYLPVLGLNNYDLRPIIEVLEEKPLIGHNIKFDLHVLEKLGWQGKQGEFFDVIVMGRLWTLEEHPQLGLKELAKRILHFDWPDPDVVKAVKAGRAEKVPLPKLAEYCCTDVWATKQLYKWFKNDLNDSLLRLFAQETKLTRDLLDIETVGVMIDQEYLEQAQSRLEEEISRILAVIQNASGIEDFNPRSTPQKRQLMEQLGIEPVKMAKEGPSWDRDSLLAVKDKHPIALDFAKYQALTYQRDGLVARAAECGGVLHFEFKNWGTFTGRLSSNGQQMPKGWLQFGKAEGSEDDEVLVWEERERAVEREFSIRRLFRPRPGHILIKADYSQIEMYVLGYYMKDKTFTAWLNSGNVHAAAAQEVWGDGVKFYKEGKTYNFATVYGQGDAARAKKLGCSIERSRQLREEYEERMPGYRKLLTRVRRLLYRDGHVANVYGREYWIDPELAYRGVNYITQGSAGDFVKFRLPATRELRRQIGLTVLNTTHDDFMAEIAEENIKHLPEWIAELQHSPFERDLMLDVEYSRSSLVELSPLKELLHAA